MFEHGFPSHWTFLDKLIWLRAVVASAAGIWKTVTGSLIHVTDALASPTQKLEVTLEPIQAGSGDPYPAGGGVNKFDESTVTFGEWTDSSGKVNNAQYGCISDPIYITGNVTLSFFGGGTTAPYSKGIIEYASDDSFVLRNHGVGGSTMSITTNANTAYVRIQVSDPEGTASTITAEKVSAMKIVLSNTATAPDSYSEYSNVRPITGWTGTSAKLSPIQSDAQGVITLSPIQAGEGDPTPTNIRPITAPLTFTRDDNSTVTVYDGTLDTVNRVLVSNADMATLTHTMAWERVGVTASSSYFYLDDPVVNGKSAATWSDVDTIGNWASKTVDKQIALLTNGKYYWTTSTGAWRVGYGTTTTTLEQFLAFLQNNPLQILCQLATPITYNLSEAEVNRAIEALGGTTYSVTFPTSTANLWDEEVEAGYYDATTGGKANNSNQIRSVNKFSCLPSTSYYMKSPSPLRICQYQADETFIRADTLSKDSIFTTESNCYLLALNTFATGSNAYPGGTAYQHDISINSPATVTSYQPSFIQDNIVSFVGVSAKTNNGVTYTPNANGSITVYGTASPNTSFGVESNRISVKAGEYTIITQNAKNVRTVLTNEAGTITDRFIDGTGTKTITLDTDDTVYLYLRVNKNNAVDTTMTAELRPKENVIYGGTYDFVSGDGGNDRIEFVFDGSENWATVQNQNGYYISVADYTYMLSSEAPIANYFKGFVPGSSGSLETWTFRLNALMNNLMFKPDMSVYDTTDKWKAYLASNPLQVVFKRNESFPFTSTPQQVSTNAGENNIWGDGTIEMTYKARAIIGGD